MKRYAIASMIWMFAAIPSFAQRFRIGEVNAETPEGKLLQQIGQESDVSKKLALMEQFAASYPADKNVGWVYEQMQTAEVKINQPEKAMEVGERLLAMDPEDAEAAQQGLKAAESTKDPDLIRRWAGLTSQAAQRVVSSPQPKGADEATDWKNRVDWANQVKVYADYSLYAAALQTSDFNKKVELIDALKAQNPQSEYLAKAPPLLFLAYRQTGANDKAIALAEEVLATDQSDEDMLLVVADHYLQTRRNPDKVHAYAAKIVEILNTKPAPAGVADADWQKHKATVTGVAHYMSGKLYYTENAFAAADRELRAALPLIHDNPQLKPEVLFYLGVADFKLEKAQDAANFNRECAALKSPYAATCAKNLTAIRTQYRGVK